MRAAPISAVAHRGDTRDHLLKERADPCSCLRARVVHAASVVQRVADNSRNTKAENVLRSGSLEAGYLCSSAGATYRSLTLSKGV